MASLTAIPGQPGQRSGAAAFAGAIARALSRGGAALLRLYPLAILAALWEAATRSGLIGSFFLPTFSSVVMRMFTGVFVTGALLGHWAVSMERAMTGLALASVVGVALGILMGRFAPVRSFMDPILALFFPTPKLALFPLFILWLGIGDASKIALIFASCLFPVLLNTYTGVRSVDKFLVWNALDKGLSTFDIMWRVILPASLPFIFAGLRIAATLAILLVVAAEMIASNDGLGYLAMFAQRTFRNEDMLAAIMLIALTGFAIDRILLAVQERLFAWQDKADFQ